MENICVMRDHWMCPFPLAYKFFYVSIFYLEKNVFVASKYLKGIPGTNLFIHLIILSILIFISKAAFRGITGHDMEK